MSKQVFIIDIIIKNNIRRGEYEKNNNFVGVCFDYIFNWVC